MKVKSVDSDIWMRSSPLLPLIHRPVHDNPEGNHSTGETDPGNKASRPILPIAHRSGARSKLILLDGFLHPGAQSGFVEGSEERVLGAVVLHRCLLGIMVAAGPHRFDPQGGG